MSDEAIIGNLLDRIRARFKADPNWGVYDGMLCRSDLEVLLDIISALESDKINNTMNLEHLTADLAAMTAERDAMREQLYGKCFSCGKAKPSELGNRTLYTCPKFKIGGVASGCVDWQWRGPDAQHDPDGGMGK